MLIGLAVIALGLYFFINDILIRNKGKVIVGKIKDVEENVKRGFDRVIIEVLSENTSKEISFYSKKSHKKGDEIKGVYYSNRKHEIISVNQEGFFIQRGAPLIVILVGLVFFLIPFAVNISNDLLILYCLIGTIVFLLASIYYNSKSLYKNITEIEKVYYGEINSNSVKSTKNLNRYQSKLTNIEQVLKIPSSTIFITVIFVFFSIFIFSMTYVNIKKEVDLSLYENTIGEVADIKKSSKSKEYKIIYEYVVDGKKYETEYDTKKEFFLISKGSKQKIYYNNELPTDAISKAEYISKLVKPLLCSLTFLIIGLYIQVNNIFRINVIKKSIVREA